MTKKRQSQLLPLVNEQYKGFTISESSLKVKDARLGRELDTFILTDGTRNILLLIVDLSYNEVPQIPDYYKEKALELKYTINAQSGRYLFAAFEENDDLAAYLFSDEY